MLKAQSNYQLLIINYGKSYKLHALIFVLRSYALRLTPYALRLTPYALRLTLYALGLKSFP